MRKKLYASFLIALFLLVVSLQPVYVQPVYAQGPFENPEEAYLIDWQELKTEHFIIVYARSISGLDEADCACGIDEAEFYAGFIDEVYTDLVVVFDTELETPINLRLFPTEQSYYEVNPIARQITGVVAHALNNREEIAIALPRTKPLTEEDIINNMRHELTHFFASLLSDGNLTAGFQEGIAQYLEKPNERTSYDPAALELAFEQQRLLTWSQLDSSAEVFRDPAVAYPQSLSITSFLVDRYGFPKFIEFMEASATEPGYRSALETVYEKSADELEAEWLLYLPEYFDGRWQINYVYNYDLSRVTQLVQNGAYSDAQAELAEIVELLQTTEQADTLAQAEILLDQAARGKAAGLLANEARQALEANDYALAISKSNAAIQAYESLAYQARIPELQVYIQRAEIGRDALRQLDQGEQLIASFRFWEAEKQIYDATVLLQSLGNQAGQERGSRLLAQSTQRQNYLAYGMFGVGGLLILFNLVRRVTRRLVAEPLELEYTA